MVTQPNSSNTPHLQKWDLCRILPEWFSSDGSSETLWTCKQVTHNCSLQLWPLSSKKFLHYAALWGHLIFSYGLPLYTALHNQYQCNTLLSFSVAADAIVHALSKASTILPTALYFHSKGLHMCQNFCFKDITWIMQGFCEGKTLYECRNERSLLKKNLKQESTHIKVQKNPNT